MSRASQIQKDVAAILSKAGMSIRELGVFLNRPSADNASAFLVRYLNDHAQGWDTDNHVELEQIKEGVDIALDEFDSYRFNLTEPQIVISTYKAAHEILEKAIEDTPWLFQILFQIDEE